MLENIKSIFFIRILFSYVDEKQKLKIIKYNKSFQKTINISIINYQHFKGERNGKGKEYHDNGKISFEGEYLNGKRNGKGKEYYYKDQIKFEGEYLNDKRNGKGKNMILVVI